MGITKDFSPGDSVEKFARLWGEYDKLERKLFWWTLLRVTSALAAIVYGGSMAFNGLSWGSEKGRMCIVAVILVISASLRVFSIRRAFRTVRKELGYRNELKGWHGPSSPDDWVLISAGLAFLGLGSLIGAWMGIPPRYSLLGVPLLVASGLCGTKARKMNQEALRRQSSGGANN